MILYYIYLYIENAYATLPHLDDLLRSGRYGEMQSSLPLCVWVSGLVAAGLDFGSRRKLFCPPGVDFDIPGATF